MTSSHLFPKMRTFTMVKIGLNRDGHHYYIGRYHSVQFHVSVLCELVMLSQLCQQQSTSTTPGEIDSWFPHYMPPHVWFTTLGLLFYVFSSIQLTPLRF